MDRITIIETMEKGRFESVTLRFRVNVARARRRRRLNAMEITPDVIHHKQWFLGEEEEEKNGNKKRIHREKSNIHPSSDFDLSLLVKRPLVTLALV